MLLVLVAVAGLPGCDFSVQGHGLADAPPPDARVPDGSVDPTCGPRTIDGCTSAECITDPSSPDYGSCGGDLIECDHATGRWEHVGYCEPFPLDVHGTTWTLAQQLVGADPCPGVSSVDAHVLVPRYVDSQEVVTAPDGSVLGMVHIEPGLHAAQATVALDDTWHDADGTALAVHVDYTLDFTWTGGVSGHATANVTHVPHACLYDFAVDGTYTRP